MCLSGTFTKGLLGELWSIRENTEDQVYREAYDRHVSEHRPGDLKVFHEPLQRGTHHIEIVSSPVLFQKGAGLVSEGC